jgi:hypothetical protein
MCACKQGQGKPQWKDPKVSKSKPKPKLKVEEEGLKKSLKDVVCQARK